MAEFISDSSKYINSTIRQQYATDKIDNIRTENAKIILPLLIKLDIKVNFVMKPGVPGTPIRLKQPKTKRPDKTG